MKVLVPVKRVVDPYVKIRIKPDHSGVVTANVKMAMNPFDEIAIEEAVRLQEKNIVKEIIAVSIGDDSCKETLRQALALGAARGILVKTNQFFEPLSIAKILQKIVEQETPNLIIMGKQAIDDDYNQTGQMLAALLNWPQATFASAVTITNNEAEVTREVDGGLETIAIKLPGIITTDLRLNEPRYAALPNIMKAKQKPLSEIDADSLGINFKRHIEILQVNEPEPRKAGIKVANVQELVDKLRHEAKVIP